MESEPIIKEKISSGILNVLVGVSILIGGAVTYLLMENKPHSAEHVVHVKQDSEQPMEEELKSEPEIATVSDTNYDRVDSAEISSNEENDPPKHFYVIAASFYIYEHALAKSNELKGLKIANQIVAGESSGKKCFRVSIADSQTLDESIVKKASFSEVFQNQLWILKP